MIQDFYNQLSRNARRELVLDAAREAKLHPATASLYLRGKKKPGPLAAEKLASLIGKPVVELFPTVEQ